MTALSSAKKPFAPSRLFFMAVSLALASFGVVWWVDTGPAAPAFRHVFGLCLLLAFHLGMILLVVHLERARGRAQTASGVKDRFLAMLSHELRTPLTPALMLSSSHEANPRLPREARSAMAAIRRNLELEVRLIDDLLDLNRSIHGKIALDLQPLDLVEVLRCVLEICRDEMEGKQQSIRVELPQGNCVVRGDGHRLQQVFWNLLKNAIKFTPPEGLLILRCERLEAERSGAGDKAGAVRVEIVDTGIGIRAENLPHLFNPFEQGDPKNGKRKEGLGLGLAICKAMVHGHGGKIHAHSDGEGLGARFGVELPLLDKKSEWKGRGGVKSAPKNERKTGARVPHRGNAKTAPRKAASPVGAVGAVNALASREAALADMEAEAGEGFAGGLHRDLAAAAANANANGPLSARLQNVRGASADSDPATPSASSSATPPAAPPKSKARVPAPRSSLPGKAKAARPLPPRIPDWRILLVEDNADTAHILRQILERSGGRITVAHTVKAALAVLHAARERGSRFDLLISDVGLPDGDGRDLMRQIRADELVARLATADPEGLAADWDEPAAPPLPGIALSGYGMDDDIRQSLQAGFHAHLTKPVAMERLWAAIAQCPAGNKSQPAAARR